MLITVQYNLRLSVERELERVRRVVINLFDWNKVLVLIGIGIVILDRSVFESTSAIIGIFNRLAS